MSTIYVTRANTLDAETGASLGELMSRMGRSSTRAARIYLHAREERDKRIAASIDKMARQELRRWEAAENCRSGGLISRFGCPLCTVTDRRKLPLIAR